MQWGSRGLVERRNSMRKMVVNKWYSSREKKLQPVYLESPNIFCSFFAVSLFCLSRGSGLPQVKVSPLVLRGIMRTCESLALPGWVWPAHPWGILSRSVSGGISPPRSLGEKRWSKKPTVRGILDPTVFFMAKEGLWASRDTWIGNGHGLTVIWGKYFKRLVTISVQPSFISLWDTITLGP